MSELISIKETNRVIKEYFPEIEFASMEDDPSAALLKMIEILALGGERIAKLEVDLKRSKECVLFHAKKIDELIERCDNIETWIDEVIKWIYNGVEIFKEEASGLHRLKEFLKSWSKYVG